MELIRFSDRIWYLPYERETDRPNLFYLKGDVCSAVIDAGNSQAHVEKLYHLLEEKGLPLPEYTIISHWHWDHTFGLPFIHGTSVASAKTNAKLKEVMAWEWNDDAMNEREKTGEDIAFCNACIRVEYADLSEIRVCQADRGIDAPETLDLGGLILHLIPRDSTHSRDALFVYVPQEAALIVGDADCKDYYDNFAKYNKNRLEEMIAFFESLPYEHHLIGHDAPLTKAEALEELRTDLQDPEQLR